MTLPDRAPAAGEQFVAELLAALEVEPADRRRAAVLALLARSAGETLYLRHPPRTAARMADLWARTGTPRSQIVRLLRDRFGTAPATAHRLATRAAALSSQDARLSPADRIASSGVDVGRPAHRDSAGAAGESRGVGRGAPRTAP
jgi:hypothetical protein